MSPLKVLDDFPNFYESFGDLGSCFEPSPDILNALEVFVCRLYKQPTSTSVNEARLKIFGLGKYCVNQMPCTKDALVKHIRRSAYQAAIWRNALNAMVDYPAMTNHGWLVDNDGNVTIDWMDLPPAPDAILENVECNCKKGCGTNRCSCKKANLCCTESVQMCWLFKWKG